MVATPDHPPLFHAVVTPHRSLGRRGLWGLIAAICAASALTTTVFFLLGAWPVAGFSGAEITLAVLMLRLHARAARRSETLLLTPERMRVIRTATDGTRQEHSLETAWLAVVLQERPARVPALLLAVRRRQIEVAADLGEDDKRDLAQALSAALYRWRHPTFDNPQLA